MNWYQMGSARIYCVIHESVVGPKRRFGVVCDPLGAIAKKPLTTAQGRFGCCETLHPSSLSVLLEPSESWINAGRSPQFRESSDEPSPCADIEFHQAFVSHFQQEGLASFFIHDMGAFHDLAQL
jgi:hypothetical protein